MGFFNLFKPKKGSKKSKRKAPAKKAGAKRTSSTSRKTVSRNSKVPGPLTLSHPPKYKTPMTSWQTAQELTSSKSSGKAKATKAPNNSQKAKKPLIQKLTSILRKEVKKRTEFHPKDEYRYNHDTQHITHVFLENESEYRAVGFTTKEKTFGKDNMPLNKNPKRGDTRNSYVRNGIVADSKRSFSRKTAKNFRVTDTLDKANLKSKERNYRKQQKRKKE